MRPAPRLIMILFICLIAVMDFGCRKNDSNPVLPPQKPEPNKAVYFVSPVEGDTLYYGQIARIQWKIHKDSTVKRVEIEVRRINTLGEQPFVPFIQAHADSLFTEYKIQLQKHPYYIFRIRNVDGGQWDTSGVFAVQDMYFAIRYPNKGDIVHIGTTISIDYINQSSKPVWFDLSTNDGSTWITLSDEKNWLVDVNPGDECRLMMRTDDAALFYRTERFRIISDLDEFIPLQIGKVFQYKYSSTHYRPAYGGDTSFMYKFSAEIISSKIINDSTIYTCRMTTKNIYPNKDSSSSYENIKEYNYGLHPITSTIIPLRLIKLYRYYDKSVSELNGTYTAPDRQSGWSWNQKKGIGLTSYVKWWKGFGMFESFNESWSLF